MAKCLGLNGLSKNGLVLEKTITTAGSLVSSSPPGTNTVRPEDSPSSPESLLASIASDHIKKQEPFDILGLPNVTGNGINALAAINNPLANILLSSKSNGAVSCAIEANPFLSILTKPILPIPTTLLENMAKPMALNPETSLQSNVLSKILKPTPSPPQTEFFLPQPRSQLPPTRYKPKPKPNYEHSLVETKQRLNGKDKAISTFPVPFDFEGLYDRNLLKDKASSIGMRFARKRDLYLINTAGAEVDENVLPFHVKMWSVMAEVFPERLFKFDTPSPDALVGNVTEFVGMRQNTTEELLTNGLTEGGTGDVDMDTTEGSLDSGIETKSFPVLDKKHDSSKRSAPAAVKKEKKKVTNNSNNRTKKSRPKASDKNRSKKI